MVHLQGVLHLKTKITDQLKEVENWVIEYFSQKGTLLHPIQEEMKKANGVQCGFCTPGIVMSIYNLFINNDFADKRKVEESLQGNLCRCTGYKPIIDAATSVIKKYKRVRDDLHASNYKMKKKLLKIIQTEPFPDSVPRNLKSLKSFLKINKNPTIIAGATDVGLWVNKDLQSPPNPVFLTHVNELKSVTDV